MEESSRFVIAVHRPLAQRKGLFCLLFFRRQMTKRLRKSSGKRRKEKKDGMTKTISGQWSRKLLTKTIRTFPDLGPHTFLEFCKAPKKCPLRMFPPFLAEKERIRLLHMHIVPSSVVFAAGNWISLFQLLQPPTLSSSGIFPFLGRVSPKSYN